MSESIPDAESPVKLGISVKNLGEPIRLAGIQIDGVAAGAARKGDTVGVWTRLCSTSDDPFFHRVTEGLCKLIESRARQVGQGVNLRLANMTLLVIRSDLSAELWVDTAAVSILIVTKRSIAAGSAVFDNDIADVTAMAFPNVELGQKDRVICIFREGWRFALFFDFNPQDSLSISDMKRDLGMLYRRLRYCDLYDAVADQTIFGRLLAAGWFPFVEILGDEFQILANHCEAGFDLADIEAAMLAKFDRERLERMFARWMLKSHFSGKERLLRSALKSFVEDDAVPVLKITLTEIEGILSDAYDKVHGKRAKLKALLDFAVASAEKKAGHPDTLLLPASFAQYLKSHTFANFDPIARTGNAGSRHAVGHGAADAETYTMTRALQALLTLDQLAFYT